MKTTMDIEKLVTWALRDQGLGWSPSAGSGLDVETLGVRIDRSVSYGLPALGVGLCDSADALAMRAAIDRLPAEGRYLVISNGRIGLRPDWGEEGYGEPVQMTAGNGKLKWVYEDQKNCRGARFPVLDWRGYDAHVRQIDYERASWTLWRESLVALKKALEGTLADHDATGPEAPACPWDGLKDTGPVPVPFSETLEARRLAANPENAVPSDRHGQGGAYDHLRPETAGDMQARTRPG